MKPKKIKLFWALGLTATLVASATVALSIFWPRLFPSLYVSDLYRRYENNEYIRATEIHNFPVNDTLAVETLLLEASTDSAWCALLLDFGMPEEMIEMYKSNKEFYVGEGRSSIIRIFINKYNPKERVPVADTNGWLTIGSFEKKSLSVFLTGEYSVKEIINKKEIKKLKFKNQKDEKVL